MAALELLPSELLHLIRGHLPARARYRLRCASRALYQGDATIDTDIFKSRSFFFTPLWRERHPVFITALRHQLEEIVPQKFVNWRWTRRSIDKKTQCLTLELHRNCDVYALTITWDCDQQKFAAVQWIGVHLASFADALEFINNPEPAYHVHWDDVAWSITVAGVQHRLDKDERNGFFYFRAAESHA